MSRRSHVVAPQQHGATAPWLQQLISDTTIDKKELWPRRPPRPARLFDNVRPFYFITFNTYKRQGLLARDEIHDTFCIFATTAREHDVAIGRYVIMPDHVHLFAAFPPHSITLPTWVQSLRNVIGKKLLRLGIHKPHWQEGFFDHLLRSQEATQRNGNMSV